MEIQSFCQSFADSKAIIFCMVESLAAEAAILAHKSLLLLLFQVGSQSDDNTFPNSVRAHESIGLGSAQAVHMRCRFTVSELNKVKDPDAENNDAGETKDEDEADDEDEDSDENDEDDGDESEEESDNDDDEDDDEEDSDDDVQANGHGGSDDDDDDDDDDEDDDDEDDDSDEDDEEEDGEEELSKLPSRRKK